MDPRRIPLEPNMQLSKTLRLVRSLDKGGMGSVWVAEHVPSGGQVAVKIVADRLVDRPKALARFFREASMAMQLDHPHIVKTIDHGVTSDSRPFLVMELLDGESLRERIVRRGAMTVRESLSILTQVADALRTAHGQRIVHRDIKPPNLFLVRGAEDDPFVKVVDFGIAKQVPTMSGLTSTGALVGTPYYMSPEQLTNAKNADSRMDLWSLAVVAFELFTGTRPFVAKTVTALSLLICRGSPKQASTLRPELPADLDAWFSRAFSRKIEDRFQSAEELAEELTAACDRRHLVVDDREQ